MRISSSPYGNSVKRGRNTSRSSSITLGPIIATIIALLVCTLLFMTVHTFLDYNSFKSAVEKGNTDEVSKAYANGTNRLIPPFAGIYKWAAKGYSRKTLKNSIEDLSLEDPRTSSFEAAFKDFEPIITGVLIPYTSDMYKEYDVGKTDALNADKVVAVALGTGAQHQGVGEIVAMYEALKLSRESFAKAAAAEKKKYGSQEAADLYKKVVAADTENYEAAQQKIPALVEKAKKELVTWKNPVKHIFTHCLIAFPKVCAKSSARVGYDTDCLTVLEFERILQALYDNNYILVDWNSLFKVDGKKVTKAKLKIPRGKKPVVLSIDDVTYDPRKLGNGMVDRLIIKEGKIATWTAAENAGTAEDVISFDNEVFPILETFLEKNPDFSWKGARATLAMTGFIGCFGYRTDRLYEKQSEEIPKAKKITKWLKDKGYTFASHGYGHRHSSGASYALMMDDSQKWQNETANVVGKTPLYIWPYGETVQQSDKKAQSLRNKFGFRAFSGVGNGNYEVFTSTARLDDRAAMDGLSLRRNQKNFVGMFDCGEVFDTKVRKMINPKAGRP